MDEKTEKTKRVCDKCGFEFEDQDLLGETGKPEGEVVCPGCGDIIDEDMFFDEKADH